MKNTKRSFLTSAVSLLLCFVMLAGTTFAWFTDTAVSNDNVIQSGNLKAAMFWSDSYDGLWLDAETGPIFTYDNWEPGYTEVKYIKVANNGNLNFKWKLSVEAEGEVSDLSDVIDVYYVNPVSGNIESLEGLTSAGSLTDVLESKTTTSGSLAEGETTILAIAFHMDELAGNEYQYTSLCADGFSVKLIATQDVGESDSFDDQYDKDAEWPAGIVLGNTASSTVTKDENNILTTAVDMTSADGRIMAHLPSGVKLDNGTNSVMLNVANVEDSKANITLGESEESLSIDVHVLGVAKSNTTVMAITVKELLPTGLNMGNYRFYHVENGQTVEMTLLAEGATPVHNNFEYDPATGDVILHLASFSEITLVADEAVWEGNFDYSWYTGAVATVDGEAPSEYIIANADQLAAFGAIVGGMANGIDKDSFKGKVVKLVSNINLGDKNDASTNLFYPIGYYNDAKSYTKPTDGTKTYANVSSFQGTFDGNGHTIANFYQNTWQMWGDYDGNYYKAAMGLFGYVYGGTIQNLTVDNFSSDGEFTPTGVIAAYAVNSTFENIAITNCNPRVYNTGNGGIIGIAGRVDASVKEDIVLRNITVDNTNKISALWGSYDVACGGLVGMYRGNEDASGDTITFANCHVSAQIDVYNDVCGNYQYYAYRYAGMIIGSIRHNTTNDEGRTIPNMAGISATGCTVNYGDWNDYYYCEFEKNGHPSYSGPDDYKFSRIPHSEINFTDTNENGVIDADERASVTGCKHDHTDAENVQCVFLPFYQLFTGYSWGVSSIGLQQYSGIVTNLDITEGDNQASVDKFEGNNTTGLVDETTYKLSDIFKFVDNGVNVIHSAITVSITNLDENGNVRIVVNYDKENWENTTIRFVGTGSIKITIQDYYFCTPTTITVSIAGHEHTYKNACDATCEVCQAIREITHTYDNSCDTTCNVCGETREVNGHVYDNSCDTTCNECGDVREITHTPGKEADCENAQTCTVCGVTLNDAIGHTVVTDEAVAPTCTATGLTEGSHCSVCNKVLVAQETVAALGHTVITDEMVPATCLTAGKTEGKHCSVCNEVLVAQTVIPAKGHTEVVDNAVAATCTTAGKTEGKHCSVCNEVLVAQQTVAAIGHSFEFESKFNGDFLYRVGNQNTVALSALYNIKNYDNIIVEIVSINGASGTYSNRVIQFTGTGIVKVVVTDTVCNSSVELNLEVVDATNVTGLSGVISGNVVLLNDCGLSSLTVSGRNTVYGNGFTATYSGNGQYLNNGLKQGVITVSENGTLDNLRIIAPVYPKAYLYYGQTTLGDYVQGGPKSEETSNGTTKTRYHYQLSAVTASGNATISNCYIYGGRTNVFVDGGNVTITDTILECGTVANSQIVSSNEYTVTFNNVTTIQYFVDSNVSGTTSQKMLGFGILVGDGDAEKDATNPKIVLNGDFKQYNWVCAEDKNNVSNQIVKMVIDTALGETEFQHTVNNKTSANLGIVYLADVEPVIENNTNLNYSYKRINTSGQFGYVYSIKNNSSSQIYTDYANADRSTINGLYKPQFKYDSTLGGQYIEETTDCDEFCYREGETIKVMFVSGDTKQLDLSKLVNISKYSGQNLNLVVTCKDSQGNTVNVTSGKVTLSKADDYVITYTVTDTVFYNKNGESVSKTITYTWDVTLSVSLKDKSVPNAYFEFDSSKQVIYYNGNSSRTQFIPFLAGLKIYDYNADGSMYVRFDGDSTEDIYSRISSVECTNDTNAKRSEITLVLADGGVLKVALYPRATSGGSTYSGSVKVADNTLYFVNGGTTSAKGQQWLIYGYTIIGNNGVEINSGELYFGKSGVDATSKSKPTGNFDPNGNSGGSGGSDGCITPDTLVTLADGTQVRVDSLTGDELLLVWNMETGKLDYAPIMFVDSDPMMEVEVVKLRFSDGTEVKVIYEHGFWDYDLNKYVYLDGNAADYIGHTFAKQNGDSLEKVTLVDVEVETELTTAWSPVTVGHLCYFVNGMLSMPGGVGGLFNIFEVDAETMTYDFEQIEKDIETYGLFTYEELNAICPLSEEMFVAAGGAYLKISIGKGNLTMEELINMINRYSKYI